MSDTVNSAGAADESFDPHRFSAEPKTHKSRVMLKLFFIFVIMMSMIGAATYIIKSRMSAYSADRAAKEKKNAEDKIAPEVSKKTKIFEKPVLPEASLPKAFGDLPPLPKSNPNEKIRPNPSDELSSAPLPALPEKAPAPIGMMMEERLHETAPAPGNFADLPAPPGISAAAEKLPPSAASTDSATSHHLFGRPRNVQEFADQKALTAPITTTQQVTAANLGNRSYLIARGTYIPCVLETQLVSSIEGNTSCVVPQNIYSDNGKVLLLERGSKVLGSYKSQFTGNRIAILWERVKTPTGVVLDVDSPTADGVGTAGAEGVVERHWMERIGAAFLLSLVEDLVAFETAKETAQNQGPQSTAGTTIAIATPAPIPTETTGQVAPLSREVLKDTLNIKPTLVKNRGDRLMVYVNRDLWFDSVYKLTQR